MLIWSGSTISNSFLGTRSKPRCLTEERGDRVGVRGWWWRRRQRSKGRWEPLE